MTFLTNWEDFIRAAERLYTEDSMQCRYVIKYNHAKGNVVIKLTNDKVCIQYRSEHAQDVKKIEKFTGQMMRLMATKD